MRAAVMQPYLFPYLPYFQLIHAVDCFVIFDTAQFIRRGWMNRNRIKLHERAHSFTVPVQKAERNAAATDIVLADNAAVEGRKLLALLHHAYGKAEHWYQLESLIAPLLKSIRPQMPFVDFAQTSLSEITQALSINTQIVRASQLMARNSAKPQDYIIDLCEILNASEYINAIGGQALYDETAFASRGLKLAFIESDVGRYPQTKGDFVVGLSILDLLANLEISDIQKLLVKYRLQEQKGQER